MDRRRILVQGTGAETYFLGMNAAVGGLARWPKRKGLELSAAFPVYVVDDDPNFREWISLLCDDSGLPCRTFHDGEEFLAALDELEPGCILLDMRMPRQNGLQVQAELGRRGNRFPVIAVTGYGDVEIAVRSMKLGAIEFLEKPFSVDVALEAIKQAFATLRRR